MISFALPPLLLLGAGAVGPAVTILISRATIERLWPMTAPRSRKDIFNLIAWALWYWAWMLFSPISSMVTMAFINDLGFGWIMLPSHGWGLVAGFIVFALVLDLGTYLFHRAEHAVPMLWAMRSVHHSDRHYDTTTAVRHHWAMQPLFLVTINIPLALMFKAPAIDMFLWGLLSNYGIFFHANVKWDYGRWWWILTSPVYHRTHHSALPEHFDCNFASLFPIWDVIFGTARHVDLQKLPPVGLTNGAEPRDLIELINWTGSAVASPTVSESVASG